MKKVAISLTAMLFLISCSILPFNNQNTPSGIETLPEGTPNATKNTVSPTGTVDVTPSNPDTFTGSLVEGDGISIIVPACLGSDVSIDWDWEATNHSDFPFTANIPRNRVIKFNSYPLSNNTWSPEIRIYDTLGYEEIIGGDVVDDQVIMLYQILLNQSNPAELHYPFLPLISADQVFSTKGFLSDFQNGRGIFFLAEYYKEFAIVPITNNDLFYSYQGITNDGKYWISATFPVNAPYLQPSFDDPTVPMDGIVMSSEVIGEHENDWSYFLRMVDKINSTPDEEFTPSLTCLRTLIESLEVEIIFID